MNIGIIGTGYVGLVTGTCFAEMGNTVTCVDIDVDKIAQLRAGELPLFEPGLRVFFERNIREGRLHFTTDAADAVPGCEVVFLALPTPPGDDGSADLSYVEQASRDIAPLLTGYTVVVTKSTVPVGTSDRVREIISAGVAEPAEFDVVSNPEFLREGVAVDDFMKPDRVVIGSSSPRAIEVMDRLYQPFLRNGNPMIVMDERSSEMTKYAANAILATKISFMNEIANVCDAVGANVDFVRTGVGADSRIGKQFLYPGIGFGGSCFPKDVKALIRTAADHDYTFRILDAVVGVNEMQRRRFASAIIDFFGGDLMGRQIAVWGLAFKPNTDDVREASSITIIESILAAGGHVVAFDPEAIGSTKLVLGDRIDYGDDAYEVLAGADALLVCTEWNEFRRPDLRRMAEVMQSQVVFDGRNLYDPKEMAAAGFVYRSIGRPSYSPEASLVVGELRAL
ncbi:MAG TPA: UDP-glucose/GDP-mannose dehydrogenase family protein [Rhodothermales bacterium]|nr:UDP-glucose/GDP-mannose dehydrogenase family protein [Rhodothermales bacterium]